MDAEDSGFGRDHIRVSDADRDQAVAELSEHFQTGRLTQDEFEERSGRALAARTGSDLRELFTDLPRRPAVPGPRATAPVAAGSSLSPVDQHHHRPTARLVIALVLVAVIVSNIFDQANGGFGWLIPVLILGLIFLRGGRHHHRH